MLCHPVALWLKALTPEGALVLQQRLTGAKSSTADTVILYVLEKLRTVYKSYNFTIRLYFAFTVLVTGMFNFS